MNSKQLGVGKAHTARGGTILVFRYHPPGNYRGQFRENVKPVKPSRPTGSPRSTGSPQPTGSLQPTGSAKNCLVSRMIIAGLLLLILLTTL